MKILALSPHPDDAEIGCGASLARFIEEGHTVHHEIMCAAENVNNEAVPVEVRRIETIEAQRELGIDKWFMHPFHHRQLYLSKEHIRIELLVSLEKIKPDLVFVPCVGDLHQDHEVVTKEALRVFKSVSVLGYEMLRNNLDFKARLFIKVEEDHINKKVKALEAYKTQAFRNYMQPGFIRALALSRGVQIDAEYAEAFEVIRWVL